jgi:NADPH:quinone reductase-like Zn-dependent oxidoreductase
MKAAIHRRYGPPEVLRIKDVPMPPVGRRDVRVRVHATTVTSGDARLRGARTPPIFALPIRLAFGLRGPRQPIPGMEFAGNVEAVGADVTRFRPGDEARIHRTAHHGAAECCVQRAGARAGRVGGVERDQHRCRAHPRRKPGNLATSLRA